MKNDNAKFVSRVRADACAAESHCVQIGSICIDGQEGVAWLSEEGDDPAWDDFLRGTSLGQYQQSSLWARAKRIQGWKPIRGKVVLGDRIAGGFQMLWRKAWFWRIGYISKGPVAHPEHPLLSGFLVDVLRTAAKAGKLSAVIVQPPDLSNIMPAKLPRDRFFPNVLTRVIESTLVMDITGTVETIDKRMSKYTRTALRQALRRGTVVREGRREDLGVFFDLMLATCRRQGVDANPGKVEFLHELWDAAEPSRSLRLTFAECKGETVAGAICLSFGETVTIWKKGWNGCAGEFRPNELLHYDAIRWANARGHKFFDFAGLDKHTAHALINGMPLTEEQKAGRDFFHLRFGGRPRLLPEALVFFSNPFLRSAYKVFALRMSRKA
jgi:hypothetical protein